MAEEAKDTQERWRAKEGEYFYTIDFSFFAELKVYIEDDNRGYIDNTRYKMGNYFRTKEEARASAKEVEKVLLRRAGELHDFTWSLEQIKQGKKVRRSIWECEMYIRLNNNCFWDDSRNTPTRCPYELSFEEIEATDWEIYEELTDDGRKK